MKKRLLLIACLILTLCLGFAACRGDDPTTDTTEGATAPDTPDIPDESGEAPNDESTNETEAPTEPETDPVPQPINRSEYPKEQAGAKA